MNRYFYLEYILFVYYYDFSQTGLTARKVEASFVADVHSSTGSMGRVSNALPFTAELRQGSETESAARLKNRFRMSDLVGVAVVVVLTDCASR